MCAMNGEKMHQTEFKSLRKSERAREKEVERQKTWGCDLLCF